ncbi:MAG: DNA polymerase III subunit delta [Candidatus Berkelbacteria bacterium]|nr:DNA polymerase III subunit delta [Candidatus Berkelbacteria bacterium]
MVIFIYGDDIYQSQKRLIGLKDKFKEKYGDINISIFNIEKKEEINTSKIISEIESMPFLGTKRLIVVRNLISCGDKKAKEKIDKKLKGISESSIVIFFEVEMPRKNDKLFRELLKLAKVEEFPQMRGFQLHSWIKKEVSSRGGKIEADALEKLTMLVGDDTWRLSNEIDKLINFSHPRAIKREEVELLVSEKVQTKIFDLVDDLARRDGQMAIKSLHRLMALGEKDMYLLSMMVYGFRNLILVKYLNETNKKIREPEMIKVLGLHPYVLRKALSASRFFSFQELKKIYHKLMKANLKIRETNNDPVLVLDLLVSEICMR